MQSPKPIDLLFPEQAKLKERGRCPICTIPIDEQTEFKDELSKREFKISGLCQKCQDGAFAEPSE